MNTDLDDADRAAIAAFATSFAKDPEGVAAVFARLQLEESSIPFDVLNDSVRFTLDREEMELAIVHAGAAGMIEATEHGDGDGEGPGDNEWMEYRLEEHARSGIALIGARRWIERFIPREAPRPPKGEVTRDEILATVDFSEVTSVHGVIFQLRGLIGTGETPRTIDRGMVAEIACERLANEMIRLKNRLAEMDDVLSGIESGAAQAREILTGARE